MSDIQVSVQDSLRRQLAAAACVGPIVDCIRKMRVEGVADSEIAFLLRHAADEALISTANFIGNMGWKELKSSFFLLQGLQPSEKRSQIVDCDI